MRHYPKSFDENRTKDWIEWNLQNYKVYGFGLWAVGLKETVEFIGDCGLTIQDTIFLHEIYKYWFIFYCRCNRYEESERISRYTIIRNGGVYERSFEIDGEQADIYRIALSE